MDIFQAKQAALESLGLVRSSAVVVNGRLDRFPPLVVDYVLSDASDELAKLAKAMYTRGWTVGREILAMPRKDFGSRPAVLAEPAARVLYHALVASLDSHLPEPTRTGDNWQDYESFGCEAHTDYVAQIDIASCYEYIEHSQLERELIVRSSDVSASQTLVRLLKSMVGRDCGIPQMHWASDRLADAYLDIMVRQLAREGLDVIRYVDDMRILARSWHEGNDAIDRAAECARKLGLTLNSEKTRVFRSDKLRVARDQKNSVLRRYFNDAKQTTFRVIIRTLRGPYGDVEELDEVVEHLQDVTQAALWKMLHDWHRAYVTHGSESKEAADLVQAVSLGVTGLSAYAERLPDDLLRDLAFAHPTQLEQVCLYIINRAQVDDLDKTFRTLGGMISNVRRGAWASLWLLHTLSQMPVPPDTESGQTIATWLREQLLDRHETVRAQAVWVTAQHGLLDANALSLAYREASQLTQPAIAAAIGRQETVPNRLIRAVRDESILNKKAYEWGVSQIPAS
ncbi:RNA-directed DNA polymerase [Micromonospora sp. NBC_01813]|uniref:RNA-directed DNA polymerase n=1 Tax=Micromonospora sp. NBC_01813 TaxID=2975988 RepID=UPI002DD8DD07|nr:RNA-directed DNA polymerase [Micromonospora sp. NBC_01813]WSA07462.1 RNA-directed DNA polymerase [Micromonospora sp. NBC_01813]